MDYFISFLEGIITFISPCLLPMLPVYISYFAGGANGRKKFETVKNAIGFVIGFTVIFVAMGAFAGSIGMFVKQYSLIVNIVCGFGIIAFGLMLLGIININIFKGIKGDSKKLKPGFFSSFMFGAIFSVGWTPCVGAFLGSALLMASSEGSVYKGMFMLFCYSLGLGVPFVISAVLVDRLENAFDIVKRNYEKINKFCGWFLIIIGILTATGIMGRLISLLSF